MFTYSQPFQSENTGWNPTWCLSHNAFPLPPAKIFSRRIKNPTLFHLFQHFFSFFLPFPRYLVILLDSASAPPLSFAAHLTSNKGIWNCTSGALVRDENILSAWKGGNVEGGKKSISGGRDVNYSSGSGKGHYMQVTEVRDMVLGICFKCLQQHFDSVLSSFHCWESMNRLETRSLNENVRFSIENEEHFVKL